jgi:hypothetical protein
MKAFPPPGKPMADRETKTEAELTALVLQTVRDAGFAWVEAVKLQSYPMRIPLCEVDDYTTFTTGPFARFSVSPREVKLDDHIWRAGMNYKFW